MTIYDPATYNAITLAISAFAGNTIPSTRFSSFGTRYLNYFPALNTPLAGGINYITNLGNTTNYDQYLGRMDYNISSKDTFPGLCRARTRRFYSPAL